ncbi:hypothetical protein RDABS01_004606, partial [Bienertia sinuspersici]
MPVESDKWGWKHVSVFGGFEKGSGTKRWICNHCNQRYNGSYSRVRAHLLGFNGLGVKPCPAIDSSVRETFTILEKDRVAKKFFKKRKFSPMEDSNKKCNQAYFREMVKTVGDLVLDMSFLRWKSYRFFVKQREGERCYVLREVDIIEGDVPDNLFMDELTNVIAEVGPSNVFQANLMLEVYEPFVRLLASFDVDKSIMGDVYNWQVSSIESLKSKGTREETLLNQVELLIESRWDKLFSPLHGVAYILHPKYFGKGQGKNEYLMRAWNATLERYEASFEARRVLNEELDVYWRQETSFGEEDAAECRHNMEPVTWWENFGESVEKLGFGADQAKEFVFVRNNLKLQAVRQGKAAGGSQSGSGNGNWGIFAEN